MSVRLAAVTFETPAPAVTAAFWAALLGREVVEEPAAVLLPGDRTQVGLRFVEARTSKRGLNRLHLHVTSDSQDDQRRIVQVASEAGGRRRGTGPLPFGRDLYLADPGGDELCVIAPGNAYLEGCGPLGEVTCEGTPAAGRFWRAAFDWPVVWDQDGQLAIQSPAGGTKIAWDGAAHPEAPGWDRQRFDLVATDPEAEIRRLTGFGASDATVRGDLVVMRDPDGTEFSLTRG